MSKSVKIVLVLLVLGAVAYIVTSSIATSKLSCEVCIDFKGRKACRTARGPTRDRSHSDRARKRLRAGRERPHGEYLVRWKCARHSGV